MEEPLEQEHSMTNDDLKPSSSSTTIKSSRSTKPTTTTTTTNGTTRRHKRRRQTNSTRSSSDHSSSSSRSSSASSHSSHSSLKNLPSNDQESKTSRSCLAQEQLQIIVEKTKTGKYDILDGFAFLSFETDEDWRIAFEHFHQQQLQQSYAQKKSFSLSGKKNGNLSEHLDSHSLHRSISVPCKIEDGHRMHHHHHLPLSAPVDDTSIENHRSLMWQNLSPNKNSSDRQSMTTIKSEPTDRTNRSSRTTSEHDENHSDMEHQQSRKSNDDIRLESSEKKHHHHHHHHHKSHKRYKTKHDLSANGDSSNKHPTITSMSDLARQHIKHESIPLPPSFNFPSYFDPKLFPLPGYPPFAPPPHHPPSFPGSYDHQLMLARGLHAGQYPPRDLAMLPPPRPPSRSLPHPFSLRENHPDSMEKMFEKYYPGGLPGYFAAAGASTNSNSPVSSLNVKMHGASPNGPDHPLWSHRDALQRQFLATSTKPSSTKSPLFDSNTKLPPNHAGPSPTDHHHRHHHHHHRHDSSTSNNDMPNSTTPTGHPLYLAPVIVTEFHQHQHNHNHTHEHKLNITTKDDRQGSPRSKTPLSNETKKPKAGFSVTDMFIDKTSPITKHSPSQQGFLSVINNKKESNSSSSSSSLTSLKKPFNGKWSTAHVHIAWTICNHQQRQRDDFNHLNPMNKIRPSNTFMPSSAQSTLLPPPLPLLDGNNDLSLLRPPMPPPPFSFLFDINSPQNNLFRPMLATKLPRPTVTSSSSSIKTPTIKREQKTPFIDDRVRRASPSPLSRPTSGSHFLPSSPSHRMKMDYSSLLLPPPPPPPQQHHQQSPFSMNDDRKRFMPSHTDLLSPFGPSPFLSSFFPMNAPPIPPPHSNSSSSSSRRSGIHSDSPKSSLFPLPPAPPSSTPFDFTRSPLLAPGLPHLPNNHFESDRYRFLLEQQARDRSLQLAMMAAASGNAPPPPLFADPNSSALFKPF